MPRLQNDLSEIKKHCESVLPSGVFRTPANAQMAGSNGVTETIGGRFRRDHPPARRATKHREVRSGDPDRRAAHRKTSSFANNTADYVYIQG